tara:strand:+ start:126 stop:464 length:339 start_codon:yes stop_codon:yes gene_type:complete
MVKVKLNLFYIFFSFFLMNNLLFANPNSDQWQDTDKTYKDLIQDGFEVKAYDMTTIESKNGLIIIMFVTVLQKNKTVYECQEYQTLDSNMETYDLSFVCRELVQPYEYGLGT